MLEDEQIDELPLARLGCFVQYDGEFKDAIMVKEGAHAIKSDEVMVKLNEG